jgi:hypothetical protein
MNEPHEVRMPDATGGEAPGRHHDYEPVAQPDGVQETLSVVEQAVSTGDVSPAGGVV